MLANPTVAILTRSEDRVQLPRSAGPERPLQGCDPHPVRRPGAATQGSAPGEARTGVAILTRSEDRVQPGTGLVRKIPSPRCDPHPVRRPGAARVRPAGTPTPVTGCDPHPVRRPGAATISRPDSRRSSGLRSSPGPKTGCSPTGSPSPRMAVRRCDPHPVRRPGAATALSLRPSAGRPVAILTRSEDRVQLGSELDSRFGRQVAILTRSEDRVQP